MLLRGFPINLNCIILGWKPKIEGKFLMLLFSKFMSIRNCKLFTKASGMSTIRLFSRYNFSSRQKAGEQNVSTETIELNPKSRTLRFNRLVKACGTSLNLLTDKSRCSRLSSWMYEGVMSFRNSYK